MLIELSTFCRTNREYGGVKWVVVEVPLGAPARRRRVGHQVVLQGIIDLQAAVDKIGKKAGMRHLRFISRVATRHLTKLPLQ